MGRKNKLAKFAEMDTIDFVFQYPFAELQRQGGFPLRGRWHADFFGNDNPITLELGCGKGEYTVGLADRLHCRNYIGVDIKGARMWRGATQARDASMSNVAFLRTDIELIDRFFAPGEVDEIWITFPDPQMQKVRKRLTSTRFMELYRRILRPGGAVRLKTDSPFLFAYTRLMAEHCGLEITALTDDLYASPLLDDILAIKTHYERQWLDRGLTIKYIAIGLDHTTPLSEPDASHLVPDTYRSYSRGILQGNISPDEA